MFDPTIRPACAADAEELATLEHDLRDALRDARGGARWLETHPAVGEAWPELLGSDERATFVAELDGLVVGYLTVVHQPDGTAHVDVVYVRPEARECGFGDALMEAALDAARERGAARLEGEALPGDRDTKNLYERAGITARLITVSTPLE